MVARGDLDVVRDGKAQTIAIECLVPEVAMTADAGTYLEDQRLAEFSAKSAVVVMTCQIPAADGEEVTVGQQTKAWCPALVRPGWRDGRLRGHRCLVGDHESGGVGESVLRQ